MATSSFVASTSNIVGGSPTYGQRSSGRYAPSDLKNCSRREISSMRKMKVGYQLRTEYLLVWPTFTQCLKLSCHSSNNCVRRFPILPPAVHLKYQLPVGSSVVRVCRLQLKDTSEMVGKGAMKGSYFDL